MEWFEKEKRIKRKNLIWTLLFAFLIGFFLAVLTTCQSVKRVAKVAKEEAKSIQKAAEEKAVKKIKEKSKKAKKKLGDSELKKLSCIGCEI